MTFDRFGQNAESDVTAPHSAGLGAADADLAEDADLIARVASGDDAAFETLVERHQRAVIGYLVGVLGDRDEALDAAQETFLRLCTRADKYLPSGSFRGWLYRIATNAGIDAIRSRRRRYFGWSRRQPARPERTRPAAAADLSLLEDPRGHALDDLIDGERTAIVRRAVQGLPAKYRAALVLRDIQELSYEETAEALGIAIGTVKSRVNRARNILRDRLASYQGTPS